MFLEFRIEVWPGDTCLGHIITRMITFKAHSSLCLIFFSPLRLITIKKQQTIFTKNSLNTLSYFFFFTFYLMFLFPVRKEYPRGDFCLFCSLPYPQVLEEYMANTLCREILFPMIAGHWNTF